MRSHSTRLGFLAIAITFGSPPFGVNARQFAGSTPVIVNANSYEDSKAGLALLSQTIKDGEIVVLIARLGDKESRSILSRKRLWLMKTHLDVTRTIPIPEKNIVTAVGDPIQGRGQIEVYLRSQLYMVLQFGPNKNFAPEP